MTNSQLKLYASLKQKKQRQRNNLFVIDGPHLVQAALGSDWDIEMIIVKADRAGFIKELKLPGKLTAVLPAVKFDKISSSKTPQGVLAIVKVKDFEKDINNIIMKARRVVVADNISDPGNLGTIIRTAAAFGYDLVVCEGGCAEVYNPKTVRATQGAIFAIPIYKVSGPQEFISKFSKRFKITVISPEAKMNLLQAPRINRPALILGNEITGISPAILAKADFEFKIEQTSRVESLNVAVAGGIAMYRFSEGYKI